MVDQAPLRAFARRAQAAVAVLSISMSTAATAQPLTLEQAVHRALAASPTIKAAQAAFPAIEGELAEARAPFWNNPQVSAEVGRRDSREAAGPATSSRDWGFGLSQTFEIAERQRLRRQSATRERAAAQENVNEVRADIVSQVSERFVRVLSLQTRIATEDQTFALIERAAQAVAKRVEAGEDSVLDSNLARVEAERARNGVAALREQLIQAQSDLATAIQWPPAAALEVVGDLSEPSRFYSVDELVVSASRRPLLRFLELRERAAHSRLALERSLAYPDVTLGVTHSKEGPTDARDRITMVTVSVPLPLFRRNQAGIGRANTELTQAEIERQSGTRLVEAQVRSLWARRQNLLDRVRIMNEALLPRLAQNQELTRKAFDAGELGLVQLLLANRQLLEAQRDVIDARAELQLATIGLETAAGLGLHINAEPPSTRPQP